MNRNTSPEDDATLVARCLRGDASAWEALVHRYQRLIFAIVTHMGLDEHVAADVFQTVFLRLTEHLPRIAEPQRLQAWIVTTAKREGLRLRERGRRTESMTRSSDDGDEMVDWDFADETPIAEAQLEDLQQLHLLRLALDRLDERCRRLLAALFEDGDAPPAYDQIAQRLAIPIGSIGPTRARCLAAMREALERLDRGT
jgi:RNA polymerase sigma factor (sigma-70 family)